MPQGSFFPQVTGRIFALILTESHGCCRTGYRPYISHSFYTTYTISVKDSVGNETVYTVYMKPISSLTEKLGSLSENTVTSADSALITEIEEQLLDIAGAFDENESTEAEWNELKAALDLCKKLENKITEASEKLDVLRTAVNGYSADTVSKKDKADLEKLAADAKALLSSGNLTSAEKMRQKRCFLPSMD